MGEVLTLLVIFSSPFIFAGGVNIEALLVFIFLYVSSFVIRFLIKSGFAGIDLFATLVFGALAGTWVSVYFGFFILGYCLCYITIEAKKDPRAASYIIGKYSSPLITISFSFMGLSYFLALYDLIL